ncbi:MAG: zinc ribbon domain-containing protein, partial [Candidatus Thermoplasmatota archaeon]|nr:zinc ribbon domain-containing protein [Candidatus Thermoplasmatota archaeon]
MMYSVHVAALLIGVVMFMRYRKVEDHEYHRSKAIRKLSRTYSKEDRGLWEKGEAAIERLEAKASEPRTGRAALETQALKSGTVGALNTERSEEEIPEDDPEPQAMTQVTGMSTMVDEQAIAEPKALGFLSRMSNSINSRMDASAQRRLEKRSAKAAAKKAPEKGDSDSQWAAPSESSLARSVVSCPSCGALNNSGAPYCTSCGDFLS